MQIILNKIWKLDIIKICMRINKINKIINKIVNNKRIIKEKK